MKRKVFTADTDKVFGDHPWHVATDGTYFYRISSGKVQRSSDRETWTDKKTLTNLSGAKHAIGYDTTDSRLMVGFIATSGGNYYLSYYYSDDAGENWTEDSAVSGEEGYDNVDSGTEVRDIFYHPQRTGIYDAPFILIRACADTSIYFINATTWAGTYQYAQQAEAECTNGFTYGEGYYFMVDSGGDYLNLFGWGVTATAATGNCNLSESYLENGESWLARRGNWIFFQGIDGDSHKVLYVATIKELTDNGEIAQGLEWIELDTGQSTNRPTFAYDSTGTEMELLCFPTTTKKVYYVTKGGYLLRIGEPTIGTYTYMFGANGQLGRGTVSLSSFQLHLPKIFKTDRLAPRALEASYMGTGLTKGQGLYLTNDSDTLVFIGVLQSAATKQVVQKITAVEPSSQDLKSIESHSFSTDTEPTMITEILKDDKFLYEGTTIDNPGGSHTRTYDQVPEQQLLVAVERDGARYISWDAEGQITYDADASSGITITAGESTVPEEIAYEGHPINGVVVIGGIKSDLTLAKAEVYSFQSSSEELYTVLIRAPELDTDAKCETLASTILGTKGNALKKWKFTFWDQGQPIAGQTITVTNSVSGHSADALFVQSYTYDPVSDTCSVICTDYLWLSSRYSFHSSSNRENIEQLGSSVNTSLATKLATADIDDAPVDGETAAPISSNWAYDHLNSAGDPHPSATQIGGETIADFLTEVPAYVLQGALPYGESNKTYFQLSKTGVSATSYIERAGKWFTTNIGATDYSVFADFIGILDTDDYHLVVDQVQFGIEDADANDYVDYVRVSTWDDYNTFTVQEEDATNRTSAGEYEFDLSSDLSLQGKKRLLVQLGIVATTADDISISYVRLRGWYEADT